MHGCREADVFGLTIQDTMNGVLDTVTTPRPEPAFELREPTGFAGAPNNCIRFHGLNIVYPSGTAVLVDCDGNAGRAWFIDFIGPQIHYLDSTLGNLVLDHNVELVKLLNCESIFFLGGSLRIANTSQGTLVEVGSATKQASSIRIGSNLSGSGVGATLIKGVNNVNGIDMSGSTVLTSPTVKLFNDPNSYITKWSTPFTAIYVDSVNGSNNNDGTQNFPFATLKRAIALAPQGSSCKILLKGDQTHTITSDIDITDKRLWVDTSGAYTNKPIITPNGFVNGTTRNEWYGFAGNGEVNFYNIEIQTGFFADNTKSLDTDKSGLLKSSSLFEIGKSTLTNCIVKIQDNAILGTGLTPSGISYLALWNCTVTTTGSGYVISNDDFSLVGLKVGVVTTIDNAARWVKNIKRAADNSPLNILSNITL
jgi:hypothetical protein